MANTRRPPTSVDNIIWNILNDIKWPMRMEQGLVKNVFYGDVNNYMQYDTRDVVSKEEIYKEICRVFEQEGYNHHVHNKREWWERPG